MAIILKKILFWNR